MSERLPPHIMRDLTTKTMHDVSDTLMRVMALTEDPFDAAEIAKSGLYTCLAAITPFFERFGDQSITDAAASTAAMCVIMLQQMVESVEHKRAEEQKP